MSTAVRIHRPHPPEEPHPGRAGRLRPGASSPGARPRPSRRPRPKPRSRARPRTGTSRISGRCSGRPSRDRGHRRCCRPTPATTRRRASSSVVDAFTQLIADTEQQQRTMLRLSLAPTPAARNRVVASGPGDRVDHRSPHAVARPDPRRRPGSTRARDPERDRDRGPGLADRHRRPLPRRRDRAHALVGPGPVPGDRPRDSTDDQGRPVRLLQHARGDDELRAVVGGAHHRARLRAPGRRARALVERRHRRDRARRALDLPRPLRRLAAVPRAFDARRLRRARPTPTTRSSSACARSARTTASTPTKRSPAVLRDLRGRGVALAICSNWDWDLHEAIESAGLTGAVDVVVSSAWVGARKPHPRIYDAHARTARHRARGRTVRRRHLDVRCRRPAGRRACTPSTFGAHTSASTTPRPNRICATPTCTTRRTCSRVHDHR